MIEGETMKAEVDTSLINAVLEALKIPHVSVLVGMLGIALIFAYVGKK